MPKQFSLTLTRRNPKDGFKFLEHYNLEGDNLLQIISQLNIAIYQLSQKVAAEELEEMKEEWRKEHGFGKDDIPF